MLVIRARIDKLLVQIANREDPDQTASAWQATSDGNFRTSILEIILRVKL